MQCYLAGEAFITFANSDPYKAWNGLAHSLVDDGIVYQDEHASVRTHKHIYVVVGDAEHLGRSSSDFDHSYTVQPPTVAYL